MPAGDHTTPTQQLHDLDAELARPDLSPIVRQALEEKRAALLAQSKTAQKERSPA